MLNFNSMNRKRVVSLIVLFVVTGGFLLGIFYMMASQNHRDGFVNTVKDIKNKPFMGPRAKEKWKMER